MKSSLQMCNTTSQRTFEIIRVYFFAIIKIYTVSWVKQANSN